MLQVCFKSHVISTIINCCFAAWISYDFDNNKFGRISIKQHTMIWQSRTYTEIYLPVEPPKPLTVTVEYFDKTILTYF